MAQSDATISDCATCVQNSNEDKGKPGIVPCLGCKKMFCLNHFVAHRKTFMDALDTLIVERDQLRSRIEEMSIKFSEEHHRVIDDWEHEMIKKIQDAAINAKKHVSVLIKDEFERECTAVTEKIASFRKNDDFFEPDLESLQTKIRQLQYELNDSLTFDRLNLNLPTIKCVNMVKLKPLKLEPVLSRENEQPVATASKPEYHSFIQNFIKKHKPVVETESGSSLTCVSPTMLIRISGSSITRQMFHRMSTSSFNWTGNQALDIKWSPELKQFIILADNRIDVLDPIEKQFVTVVRDMGSKFTQIVCWKHLCLVLDTRQRIFLYEMNTDLKEWFLMRCWFQIKLQYVNADISAICLNDKYIVASIYTKQKQCMILFNYDMQHIASVNLSNRCKSIQALPNDQWLLWNSNDRYTVIDANLEEHDESAFLPVIHSSKCCITCDEQNKVLVRIDYRNNAYCYQPNLAVYYG